MLQLTLKLLKLAKKAATLVDKPRDKAIEQKFRPRRNTRTIVAKVPTFLLPRLWSEAEELALSSRLMEDCACL